MTRHPILEAIEVTKLYGANVALDRLTLTIYPGEIYCLLGPNGAGKSTALNLFLGFQQPTSGSVRVAGQEVASDTTNARWCLGYLPEQVALYPTLSARENLAYFAALAGQVLSRADGEARLHEVGLPERAWDDRLGSYSKGMRQKVGIAIALARNARALLLDEPTSGLDPNASSEFGSLIEKIANSGVAVLMATHDLFRAKALAGRFGVLNQGRLMREFNPSEFSFDEIESIYRENTHSETAHARAASL